MMSVVSFHKPSDLTLAMGGTEERLQLVLGTDGPNGMNLLASREWTVPGQSIRFLTSGLKETLDAFDIGVDAITRIACVRGPGSFTGLRLVLAAAEGLAAGQNIPVAGIDYLSLLASGPAALLEGPLHVLTYARRGLVYLQTFETPSLKQLTPLTAYALDDAAGVIRSVGNSAYLMGSALRKNQEYFEQLHQENAGYTLLDAQWDNASPQTLLDAAALCTYSRTPIDPVYVRATDAEDNLPQIAKKRGIDPDAAIRKLAELQNT